MHNSIDFFQEENSLQRILFKLLDICDTKEMDSNETRWIKELKSVVSEFNEVHGSAYKAVDIINDWMNSHKIKINT